MLIFLWDAARATERRTAGGNVTPFLFYLHKTGKQVLPALLASTAANANQTIWASWNQHCVQGQHQRQDDGFFFFQWNRIGHQIIIYMAPTSADKTSGGVGSYYEWVCDSDKMFILRLEEKKRERGTERGEKPKKRFFDRAKRADELRDKVLVWFQTFPVLCSHMGMQEGYARVRQTGRVNEAASRDGIWCLN